MAVDWTELPRDLLQLIFEKLIHISDQYQFGRVCSSWRTLALEHRRCCFPPNIPGLLIPGKNCNTSCKYRRFLPSPVGKEVVDHNDNQSHIQNHQLPLLPIPHETLCRGSYEDWLVMVEKNMSMYLLNPFSGTRIYLPPVTALPCRRNMGADISKWYVNKVILSRSPSSSSTSKEDCVVVVFYWCNELAFCKLGEKKVWSLFQDCPEGFEDGIFYKNSFFFVNHYGQVFICDNTMSPQPKITHFAMSPEWAPTYVRKWYLVESSAGGGELLLILRDVALEVDDDEKCSNQVIHVSDDEGDDENDFDYEEFDDFDYDNEYENRVATYVSKTRTFEIFVLDTAPSGSTSPTWLEVESLDGEALFLGLNQSFSLRESHFQSDQAAGYRHNRIYFTDDDIGGHKLHLLSGNDMGIFNLDDSTIEPLYLIDSESTKPPAVWVTPKPYSWCDRTDVLMTKVTMTK